MNPALRHQINVRHVNPPSNHPRHACQSPRMVLRIAALRGSRCLGSYTFTVLEAEAEVSCGRDGILEGRRHTRHRCGAGDRGVLAVWLPGGCAERALRAGARRSARWSGEEDATAAKPARRWNGPHVARWLRPTVRGRRVSPSTLRPPRAPQRRAHRAHGARACWSRTRS